MPAIMGIHEELIPAAAATLREAFAEVSAVLARAPYLADGAGGRAFGGAVRRQLGLELQALRPTRRLAHTERPAAAWLTPRAPTVGQDLAFCALVGWA